MFRHIRLAGLVVILLLAALIAYFAARPRQHAAAQDKAPPPPIRAPEKAKPKATSPGMPNASISSSALDRARADVLTALNQYREAETRLREAEARLREIEGRGKPAAAAPAREGPEFHVIALRFAQARAIAATLSELYGPGRVAVAVDQRTNSLILRANLDDIMLTHKLLEQLDVAVDQPHRTGDKTSNPSPHLPK